MKRTSCIVLALFALAAGSSAHPQTPKSKRGLLAVQAQGSGGAVSISFVQIGAAITSAGANQAAIDFGPVSYLGGSSQPGVRWQALPGVLQLSTDFGIRADRQGTKTKTATVSVFLLSGGSTSTVSVDGIRLSSSPQVITPNANFGVVVAHVLTIGVPTTSPPGPLTVTVGVMAVTN